ncbi:hypothetical protein [Paenibacillus guangzhouensis]|uniref:hypothetical protein n=1 Tax=Paenibacillus guangzhouensis TaxID=1473112 RepID=UPI0012677777|nr:hypothetical protein [Paenibacillus guangzhouensis]
MKKMILILGVLFLTACSFRNEIVPVQQHIPQSTSSEASTSSIIQEMETLTLEPSWSVFYRDETELEAAADLVIRGKAAHRVNSPYVEGNLSTYHTNTQVIVLDVIKTDDMPIYDDAIIVSQMGGTFGKLHVVSSATTLLTENQEVVLFLRRISDGVYRPINEDDSIYVKTGDTFLNIATKSLLRESYNRAK